eukprot:4612403-Alexandrium_andersonii.AAC.1
MSRLLEPLLRSGCAWDGALAPQVLVEPPASLRTWHGGGGSALVQSVPPFHVSGTLSQSGSAGAHCRFGFPNHYEYSAKR